MSKTEQFRNLLTSGKLEFICEAHNGLSAIIAEEAGFKGLWGSSLTMSAALGVRDNNEASWTQILDVVEFITDVTSIPLLLDADTGYGNFNTVRRLVRKLEQRNVAAMCIEDKLFPKKNSFIGGDKQPLAEIDEFVGKIKAAKDTQVDPNFSVIARVEAFIAGWGLGEALKRADAYHNAGADAILMHSKISRADEVLAFKTEWGDRCPVVIVPTKYYSTPTAVFREAGFSLVIWANMLLRSGIKAMQETANQLIAEESLLSIEDRIPPVSEIFRLQSADELEAAEKLYLAKSVQNTEALILAASQGSGLGDLTKDRPKAMIEISKKPLLYKQIDTLNEVGIKNITVVRGYMKELINTSNLRYVDNDDYATTQEVYSLYKGIQNIEDRALISYGDILYKKFIPSMLLERDDDFVVVVDADWKSSYEKGLYADFVTCDKAYEKHLFDQDVSITAAGNKIPEDQISGEWIGLLKLSSDGVTILKGILDDLYNENNFRKMRMTDLFAEIIKRGHKINVQYITGHWLDVDNIKDLSVASAF